MLSTKASSADVDLSFFPLYGNCSWVDVRQPASLGMSFRVAYAMSKLNSLATNITLHG